MVYTRKMAKRRITVEAYSGTNETINRLMGDEKVWVVQGPAGRMPIISTGPDEAVEDYLDNHLNRWEELNTSDDNDVE